MKFRFRFRARSACRPRKSPACRTDSPLPCRCSPGVTPGPGRWEPAHVPSLVSEASEQSATPGIPATMAAITAGVRSQTPAAPTRPVGSLVSDSSLPAPSVKDTLNLIVLPRSPGTMV